MNVMGEMCATCIFRPGNLMHLEEGRVEGMVEDSLRSDSFIVCHSTLGDGNYNTHEREDDFGDYMDEDSTDEDEDYSDGWANDVTRAQAVCRGYYNRHGGGQLGRISERIGLLNLNFERQEECG